MIPLYTEDKKDNPKEPTMTREKLQKACDHGIISEEELAEALAKLEAEEATEAAE